MLSQQEAMREVGPNDRNQEAIGASYNALSSLVGLCSNDKSEDMKRKAAAQGDQESMVAAERLS